MKCLVLGGAGFIGSHVVDALVSRKHAVRVFDLPDISRHNLALSSDAIEFVGARFEHTDELSRALEGVDVLVHLIGTTVPATSNANPAYDVETNVVGTLHLLRLAVEHGVRKVIFGSSGGTVYGIPESLPTAESHATNPICSYGITKLAIEKYLGLYRQLHGLEYVALRMANPYGERQSIHSVQGAVAVFLGNTLLDKQITIWGDGSVARDYFHVEDLVSAYVSVIESTSESQIYNIGGGRAYTLNELVEIIRCVTGKSPRLRFAPARDLDIPTSCLDISRAGAELGWRPRVSLEEGIQRTWAWLQDQFED